MIDLEMKKLMRNDKKNTGCVISCNTIKSKSHSTHTATGHCLWAFQVFCVICVISFLLLERESIYII